MKTWPWILVALGVIASAALISRRSSVVAAQEAASVPVRLFPTRAAGPEEQPPLPPSAGTAAKAAPAPEDPAPPSLPVPAADLREPPEALREWLLQLPAPEFRKLVGTRQMDEYVACVLGGLQAASLDRNEGPREVGNFLRQLNAQILQARSTVEPGR